MPETFSTRQLAVIAAANKTVYWLFRVQDNLGNIYYWSTGEMASSGSEAVNSGAIEAPGIYTGFEWQRAHTFKIINFSGVSLRRNKSETGIHAPNDVSFSIVNSSNVLTADNFTGGTVRIGIVIDDGNGKELCGSWRYRIKSASPYNQQIDITAEDFMQEFLKGSYPNTRLISDIFPNTAGATSDNLCIPEPYGTCYIPLRSVYAVDARYYLLGDTVNTYTINEVRSPRELGSKLVWTSAGFTFAQATKADAAAVNWRVFQPLIHDGNPGLWKLGSKILDMPTKFSRSDTASVTNPADIIRRILRNMGAQDYDLNLASFDAAKTTFAGWGLTWNFAFWYKQDRVKVLAQLLAMCHSCLIVGEQISLRVLVKASQQTITSAEVLKMQEVGLDTFKYTDAIAEKNSDSGYVAFQQTGESQDEFISVLVPAKSAKDVIDKEVIIFPGVQDTQQIQKLGTLYYQRKFLKSADISATLKGLCLALRPDDVITINYADYGGTYNILIDEITIKADVSIDIHCLRFSEVLDDWGDLAPGAITITSDTPSSIYSPVISGPDSTPTSGNMPNSLPGRLRVGQSTNYILLEPASPLRVSLYSADVERIRIGNLNGFLDYITGLYGIAIGDATDYLKYDTLNGLRISGNVSAGSGTIGGWTIGATTLTATGITLSSTGDAYIAIGVTPPTTPTAGTGIFLNKTGLFGLDANTQRFKLGVDGSGWLGAATTISWTTAGVVTVAGFTVGNADLTKTTSGNTTIVSSGTTAFTAGPTGSPTFTVSQAGVLTATGVVVSGAITASSGSIGSFTIGTYLYTGSKTAYNDTNAGVHLGSDGIGIGNNVFTVSSAGVLVATSATIVGAITANSGTIGSFTIGTYLYTGSKTAYNDTNAGVHLGSDGIGIGNNVFTVSSAGALVATSATITGAITATSGAIGSFTIGTYLYTGTKTAYNDVNAGVHIGSDGLGFGNNVFTVSAAGALVATSATITGTITATSGTIAGFTVDATEGLYAGTGNTRVQMKPGAGIWCGETVIGDAEFSVTNAGVIKAVSGTIGGCTLAVTSIGSTTFVSGPLGSGWNISNTGTAEFQNALIRGVLRTSVFEKDTVSAINGMVLISKADVLSLDMTALDASTLTISGETIFAANEVIRIKDGTNDEWMLVTSAASAPTYTVTRDLAGSYTANNNPVWKKGTAIVSMGVGTGTKTGFVLLDSSSANSPFIDIYGRNSNTYTDYTLHARLGWLKGIVDADVGLNSADVWGLYSDSVYLKGVIVANTGYIGGTTGWVIATGKITSTGIGIATAAGDATYAFWAGDNTPANAEFSVKHDGTLYASSATIVGAITANSGTIGSFTIGTYLYTGTKTAYNDTNTGVHLGSDGIGIGNNVFTVSSAGALVATSATITGVITANTGYLGGSAGWVISTNYIKDVAGVVGLSSVVTAGDDIRFWAGHATPASAPFYVTEAGALVATSATITGAITATSGTFTGTINATAGKIGTATNYWSIGATGITATSASTDVIINYGKTDFDNTQSGFILGYDFSASKAKLYVGDATSYLNWDGSALTYTKGTLAETIIQMYTSIASLKTSATAGDGSASSAGMVLTYEGLFGCGANQTATIAGANANVRILANGTAYFRGVITADTGYIGGTSGWVIAAGKITSTGIGLATAAGDATYAFWSGDNTPAIAEFSVTHAGALVATNATITGAITATSGSFAGAISASTIDIGGADATSFHVDIDGNIWSGAATYAGGIFKVSNAGALTATGATISGTLTASAGTIGGFTLSATALYAGSVATRIQLDTSAGIHLGATAFADAPFKVSLAGALTSTSATITGAITATSGSIGSFTIGTYLYTGTKTAYNDANAGVHVGSDGIGIGNNVFTVSAAGVLNAVSGTIGGNVLGTTFISSTTFTSGLLGKGWKILNTGVAEFQDVTVRGVIRTSVFEKDTISAINGIVLISKADVLAADMTALDASTITITGETTFVANEVIRIKDGLDDEWMLVTNAASAPTYTVTRDLAASYVANTNPVWKKGTAVVSMGVGTGTKTGFILLDSSSANSPFIDIYARNSNTYTDYTLKARLGWLQGIIDADVGLNSTDVWGLYSDSVYLKGTIVASTGYIGGTSGWAIAAGKITSTGIGLATAAGDATYAFWAGDNTPANAEFSVTHTGALVATNATISGAISAGTIDIGGDDATSFHVDNTGGIWSGASIANKATAPFRVSNAGALVATSATITGVLTTGVGSSIIADYITAGTITGSTLQTAASGKRFVVSTATNEARFYGDRGDGTISLLASIGINTYISDNIVGYFGDLDSLNTRIPIYAFTSGQTAIKAYASGAGTGIYSKSAAGIGIHANSDGSNAIYGSNTVSGYAAIKGLNTAAGSGYGYGVHGEFTGTGTGTSAGVYATSTKDALTAPGLRATNSQANGIGGICTGGTAGAPIVLTASSSSSAPSHTAPKGSLWVTSAGVLHINTDGSTTWVVVGSQT